MCMAGRVGVTLRCPCQGGRVAGARSVRIGQQVTLAYALPLPCAASAPVLRPLHPTLCPCQLVQGKLADMYTTTSATRAFVYSAARAADAGRANRKDCAAVILYAAEHATRMALDAIQLLGGNG